jgi:hypothetical protein
MSLRKNQSVVEEVSGVVAVEFQSGFVEEKD